MKWAPIPGYEHYEVSDDGRIRRGERILATHNNAGYQCFCPKRAKHLLVHRAMAMAFLGPAPFANAEVRHIRGGRLNFLGNLAWGSRADNAEDRKRMFESSHGESHPRAKLDSQVVREMRRWYAEGTPVKHIASRAGVAYNTAEMAVKRRTWRHVA